MQQPASPLLQRLPKAQRVAVLRASRIGDFICAVPALRGLRSALPDAEITLIGLPFTRALAERCAYLDRFEEFSGWPGIAEQFFDARRAVTLIEKMQREEFDLVVQMHGSGVYSNPFALMLGGRATAGFVRPGDLPRGLDAALPYPERSSEVERCLALVELLGAYRRGRHTEYPLRDEDQRAAEELLEGLDRPLFGIHPAASDAVKRWRPQRFATLARELRHRYGGTVVVVAGWGERDLARAVADSGRAVDLAGRTTWPSLGAVIARLDAFITNDSGPAHVAYALGAPSVTIFGATDPCEWGPPVPGPHVLLATEVACRPCSYRECPVGYPCLDSIEVEDVLAAVERAIASEHAAVLGTAATDVGRLVG